MLDPYLSCYDHIDYIGRKISAKLSMLHKARKVKAAWVVFNTL